MNGPDSALHLMAGIEPSVSAPRQKVLLTKWSEIPNGLIKTQQKEIPVYYRNAKL